MSNEYHAMLPFNPIIQNIPLKYLSGTAPGVHFKHIEWPEGKAKKGKHLVLYSQALF